MKMIYSGFARRDRVAAAVVAISVAWAVPFAAAQSAAPRSPPKSTADTDAIVVPPPPADTKALKQAPANVDPGIMPLHKDKSDKRGARKTPRKSNAKKAAVCQSPTVRCNNGSPH